MIGIMLLSVASTYGWLHTSAYGVLFFHVIFWMALFGLVHLQARGMRSLVYFLPLFFVYYFTFFFQRHVPEAFDFVFNTDTVRYLDLTAGLSAESRHAAWPLFLFVRPIVASLQSGVWSEWVKEYLYVQLALIGMLGVTSFFVLLRSLGTDKLTSLLMSYILGVSLAYWTFSSLLESYVISCLMLLQLLLVLWRYLTEESSWWHVLLMAGITTFALTVSQENIYFLPCIAVALLYKNRARTFVVQGSAVLAAVCVAYFSILSVAASVVGPSFYHIPEDWSPTNTIDSLLSFWSVFSGGMSLLSYPVEVLRPLVTAPIMSVLAQPLDISTYDFWSFPMLHYTNVVYYAFGIVALEVAVCGWCFARRRQLVFLGIAGLILAMRHFLMVVFNPWGNILFAVPTIVTLWLLIGVGISLYLRRYPQYRTGFAVYLGCFVAFLATVNASYLLLPR